MRIGFSFLLFAFIDTASHRPILHLPAFLLFVTANKWLNATLSFANASYVLSTLPSLLSAPLHSADPDNVYSLRASDHSCLVAKHCARCQKAPQVCLTADMQPGRRNCFLCFSGVSCCSDQWIGCIRVSSRNKPVIYGNLLFVGRLRDGGGRGRHDFLLEYEGL